MRLYTLTRGDLTPGQKTAQSGHALAEYIIEHQPHLSKEWVNGFLINLELGSEKSLRKWIKKLENLGIKYSIFREPDLDNQITSIALLNDGSLLKGIPLLNR